jgi:outer membrane protein TolC
MPPRRLVRTVGCSLVLLLAGGAAAAPGPGATPKPAPATPTAPAPASPVSKPTPLPISEELKAFDKELDALFAQGGLTAELAAGRAAKASPEVRRKVAEVDAAIASAEQAEIARVPQVGAKVSYTRLSPLDAVNFGAFSIPIYLNSWVTQAQVAVPISDYVIRFPALVEGAKLGEQTAEISKRASEVSAGAQARLAYYEWVRARLQVLIAQRQLAQVDATLTQVRALAEVQRLSKADLMRVESNRAQAQQAVYALTNLVDLREDQLRILIDAPASEALTMGEDIRLDVGAPAAVKLDELIAHATLRRLDLKTLDTGIAAKAKQVEAEAANKLPRLAAFASVDFDNPNQRVFPQKDEFKLTWAAGLQVTWTLNDFLNEKYSSARLRAENDQLRADRERLLQGTRLEVLAAQQAVSLAEHALETSAQGLAAAEEGYRVRRELLAAERATAVELVDSETDLTRARIAALNARVDLRVAMTQLTHALGDDAK